MILLLAVSVTAAALIAACTAGQELQPTATMEAEVKVQEVEAPADPQGALDAIYETLPDASVEKLEVAGLEEYMNIPAHDTLAFYAYYSDAKNGLCDIVILQPKAGNRDQLREALYAYRDTRVEEFTNFDILKSLEIAEAAEIYDQGEYLILLMLSDNNAAQDIIDSNIPQ